MHIKNSLGFYSRLFLVPKPGNHCRPVIDLYSLSQDGNPRVNTCLPQERRVGYIHRSDRRLPICPYPYPVTKVPQVLPQRRHLPIYQPPVRPSHGPIGVHKPCKRSQTYNPTTGNQTTPIFGRLVDSSSLQTGCIKQTQKLLKLVKDLGFVVHLKKSELIPSQRFDFLGYHFLLDMTLVKPTQDRWTKIQEMFHRLSLKSVFSARTLMSTIGLLASTQKTVKLGRIHMRPFQWHLKTHWKYPMPLDTPIPWNQKLIRHREWLLDPENVLQGEFLHRGNTKY